MVGMLGYILNRAKAREVIHTHAHILSATVTLTLPCSWLAEDL